MSMEAPALDAVLGAVSALFDNPNTVEKEKASKWLGRVQKSIHSWKIADDMLQQKHSLNACYFAAQTMRSKIQQSFFELPVDAHASLRDSLISHINQITPDTNTIIITQLCLALADLALQMPAWQNCIGDLVTEFSTQNSWALLEILTVLPQEVDSSSLKLGENRRQDFKNELKNNSNMVMSFLKESMSNSAHNSQAALKIIKCLTSWIYIKAIDIKDIPDNFIISQCFHVLADYNAIASLHEAATDCVCTLLHSIEETENNEDVERLLYNSVASLENAYHMAVANEEQDKATNYSRVFTELAETFLLKIIIAYEKRGGEHFALKSLDLALICVGHHDYEVAEITFNLWYRLSEELYQRDQQELTDVFRPHVERLVAGLARHCQMEPDHTGLLDEGDEFYDFRLKVLELIKDVIFIIGSNCCFRQMFLTLQGSNISWEQTEAALYVMQAVAKCIIPELFEAQASGKSEQEENEVVPRVVEAILAVPDTAHVAVRKTCVLLLGELCEWIDYHAECLEPALQYLLRALQQEALASHAATALQTTTNVAVRMTRVLLLGKLCEWIDYHAEFLEPALQYLLRTLQQEALASNAATALQSICKACRHHMAVHLAGLLQIVRSLDTFKLSTEAAIGLLRGVAAIISRLPAEQMTAATREAAGVQLAALETLARSESTAVKKGTTNDPVVWLDRLAALFREIELKDPEQCSQHPCLPALSDSWPILSSIMDKYSAEGRVMERLCRTLRFAIRSIKVHAAPLLEPLVVKMVQVYSMHGHSCFLYLGSILVDEFASEEGCVPGLMEMLRALIPKAFDLLQQENGLKENPDTVDDLFRLCVRFLQRAPLPLLRSPVLAAIMQCALLASSLDHKDANSSVMKFFYDLIHISQSRRADTEMKALVDETLEKYGEALVGSLLHASVFRLHPYMLPEVGDVLVELAAWRRPRVTLWLQTALQRLPEPTASATAHATPQQIHQFHTYSVQAETSKEMSRLLREFSKLYR